MNSPINNLNSLKYINNAKEKDKSSSKSMKYCGVINEDTQEMCKTPRYQGYIFCLRHSCEFDIGTTVNIAVNKETYIYDKKTTTIIYTGHNKRNFRNKNKPII